MVLAKPLALVLSAGLLGGCITGERPEFSNEPESQERLASEMTTSTEAPKASGSVLIGSAAELGLSDTPGQGVEAVDDEPVLALVTPSGVIVPVLSNDAAGYVVRTPCGETTTLESGTPIASAQVALDPGHGAEESGAVGPNGLQEKDLNLALAKRAARELERRGISVILTRTADYRIPLATRAEIGNRLGSELMVSIHHNAPNWLPSDLPGTEVFVQSGSDESRRLGGLIWEEVTAALSQFEGIAWTTNDDAGALAVMNDRGTDSYGMIRRPEMPAVLAEFGYISNPSEAELFTTEKYQQTAAVALADAVERWLTTADTGSGFVDEPRIFTPSGATGGAGGCLDPALE